MRRIALLMVGLSLVVGCTDTGCDEVLTPLEEPIPNYKFFADGAVARVSPAGVNFLEDNLAEIVGDLAAFDCGDLNCPASWATCDADNQCKSKFAGYSFIGARIPPATEDIGGLGGVFIDKFHVCRPSEAGFNDCSVYVEVGEINIDPGAGNGAVGLTADVLVWSSPIKTKIEYLVGSQDCSILLRQADNSTLAVEKTLSTTLSFSTDPNTGRLAVEVANPDVAITEDDVVLCSPFDGILKGLVFGFVEDSINEQIQSFTTTAIEGFLGQACTTSTQCDDIDEGATCNSDDLCEFPDGKLMPRLLGFEGALNLNALLGGFAGDASAVDFSIQADDAAGSGSAITVALKGAVDGESSTCVPSATVPNPTIPDFFPAVIGDHIALAASDKLLNRLMYEVYRSGALCQSLSGESIPQLQSGVLSSLLIPSLKDITKGSVPLTIDLRPTSLPTFEIGKNVIGPDPNNPDQDVLLEPLLNLVMNDLDLDVYAEVESALVRVLTLRVDLIVDLSLALGASGELVLVAGDAANWVNNAEVINSQLLAEDPATVAESIPTLLGIALPFLTDSLDQQFAIPSFAGFNVSVNDITGSQSIGTTVRGDTRYAHLGIYADLDYDSSQADTLQIETVATLRNVDVPTPEAIQAGDKVRVTIDVDTLPALDEAPVVWVRVDGGLWRPPASRRTVVVTDPLLHAEGTHTIEIAAARAAAPATLDRDPQVIEVVVDARDPVIVTETDGETLFVTVSDTLTPAAALRVEARRDGGVWDELLVDDAGKGSMPFDPSTDLVDVRVTDGAGRFAHTRVGGVHGGPAGPDGLQVVEPGTPDADAPTVSAGSCSHTGVPGTAPWGALVWGAMLVVARRRRR